MLGKEIKIKKFTKSESDKYPKDSRLDRFDILAEENGGTLIIVEVQFTPEIDYFHRMLFGSSKAIAEHIGKGMDYSKVRKVYSVNVVYFDLGAGRDYIYHGTTTFRGLHYKDELKLTEKQKAEFARLEIKDIYPEYYILKVDRFKNSVKNKIDEWMYFLKNSEIKPKFKAQGLAEAAERLEYSRLSLEDRRAYEKYVDIRRSNKSTVYTAKLEGEAIGEARGLEKGKAIGEARGLEKGIAEGEARVLTLVAKGHSLEQIKKILKGKK